MRETGLRSGGARWVDVLGAIGAIAIPAIILYSFLTSSGDDYGDTGAALIAYAEEHQADHWLTQVAGLLAPLLLGMFVASLWGRLRGATEAYRVLAVVGGILFIAFFTTSMTLWSAPLLAPDELTQAGAEAYLAFDDVGWVLLASGGTSVGVMIIGVALAARELALLPSWAVWVSVALGVISFATVMAVGIFAWVIWLVAAGVVVLVMPRRDVLAPGQRETGPEPELVT